MFVMRPPVAACASAVAREPSGASASSSGGIQAMAGIMAAPRGALLSERAAGEVGDELRRRRVEADDVEHAGVVGSAIENPFETMPTTTRRASMPDARRYSRSACAGWMSPAQVSESV